jgi:hypothetical protein
MSNVDTFAAYKLEFNALRNVFGLPAFTDSQFKYDMDPGEMVDERLGQYRFGLDDHTNCVNGLCENWLDECKGIIYDEDSYITITNVKIGYYDLYPYVDTVKYHDESSEELTNNSDKHYDKILDSTTGGRCSECGGEGTVECGRCEGEGRMECYHCDGYGEEDCEECGGDGEEDCEECGGAGTVDDCSTCDGEGNDSEGNSCSDCNGSGREDCSKCDGNGKQNCRNCEYGKVTCHNCDGDRTVECHNCDGDGYVNCDECN